MPWYRGAAVAIILIGALVLAIAVARGRAAYDALPFVASSRRRKLRRQLGIYRALTLVFLAGYPVVAAALSFGFPVLSEALVALIFFLGAGFVLLGTLIQNRLLAEIMTTFDALIPICAECKRVREQGGDPQDPSAWKPIERYVTERVNARFTHGYCPNCAERLLNEPLCRDDV